MLNSDTNIVIGMFYVIYTANVRISNCLLLVDVSSDKNLKKIVAKRGVRASPKYFSNFYQMKRRRVINDLIFAHSQHNCVKTSESEYLYIRVFCVIYCSASHLALEVLYDFDDVHYELVVALYENDPILRPLEMGMDFLLRVARHSYPGHQDLTSQHSLTRLYF